VNLATIIDEHPAAAAALMSRQRETTYGELRDQVARLRGGLAGLGLEPGDRVGIICANNWYFVASYLAVLSGGLVAVPLNPQSPAAELTAELAAVGARAVIVGPAGASAFAQVDRAGLVDLEHVVTTSGSDIDGALDFDELVAADPTPVIDREPDDLAVLVFTSGTAGAPKAAMLTHGSLLANLDQTQRHPGRAMTADDVTFGVLPLFHIFGLNVALGLTLRAGAQVVLVERFDPASALETIAERGVTVVAGAPPMWVAWAAMADADPAAFATIRLALSGASKLAEETTAAFQDRYGLRISEGYGLTEASPVVTSAVERGAPPGSIGRPVPGVEIRLVDADGDDAVLGDSGEIWVRGANVFAGYWHDTDATERTITPDGWLRTGDVAVADDDGNLYIVDRAKDLIIVSGFNVYPAEVEEILLEHPAIEAAAVVGVPHPYSGEAVKAYVVVTPGRTVEEDEVIGFAAERLARYKCPTKVNVVEEIPQGMAGKVLRRQLRSA